MLRLITIDVRRNVETYRMRSVRGGYEGDLVTNWTRVINGKVFEFTHIVWGGGTSKSIAVYPKNSTEQLHYLEG